MNDSKNTPRPVPAATPSDIAAIKRAATDPPPGIPVKLMRFTSSAFQIPGYSSTESCSAQKMPDGREWVLEYIPAMRHHRITYTDPNRKEHKVGYVHETHVRTWEPVEA